MSTLGSKCRELGDDVTIDGAALLWRRIPPKALDAAKNPDSSNFVDDETGELSVALASLTSEAEVLEGHAGFGLVSFRASDVRALGDPAGKYVVRRAPLKDDPAHTVICPRLGRGDARKLRDLSEWVVEIA